MINNLKIPEFIFRWFAVLLLVLNVSCAGSKETQKTEQSTPETATENQGPDERELFLEQLNTVYSKYDRLFARFTLKGKADNKEIFYDGTIVVNNGGSLTGQTLNIVLKDPVFRSPFFTLKIENGQVTRIDHMRNQSETLPLNQFHWVELFGSVFPFRMFYPLLAGFTPAEVFDETSTYQPEKNRVRFGNQYYQVITNFQQNIMTSIYFKSLTQNEITAIQFLGKSTADDKRYFPKEIMVTRSVNKDYIRLIFSYVNLK